MQRTVGITAVLTIVLSCSASAATARDPFSPRVSRQLHALLGTPSPDFNGDGLADQAVGAPAEDVGSLVDAGAVDVLYGSVASGLQVDAPAAQFWTQDSPGMPDQAAVDNRFGWSLAPGDFNGDGYTDLAIGAATEDASGKKDSGAVNVLYGSPAGLQTTSPAPQFWSQDSPGMPGDSNGDDRFGRAMAAGDFNGDGFADLIIGVPFEATNGKRKAGAANVLYGSAAGLQADAPASQLWSQDSPGVLDRSEPSDRFGWSFAVADFNEDGYVDAAIGVTMESVEDPKQLKATGAVNVLYGSPSGLQSRGQGAPDDQFWQQGSGGVPDQAEERDRFGWSLSSGDFNGDGYADLVVGVPFEDLDNVLGAGGVNVMYGSPAGLQTTDPPAQFWTQDSPGVLDQAEQQDWFGWAQAGGDFNADGYDDLAIGVRTEDTDTVSNAGAVNVLYGSPAGLQTDAPPNQFWTQDSPDVQGDAAIENEFGWNLDAADFTGTGYAALVIGVPLQDDGAAADTGAIEALYGAPTGLQADGTAGPNDQLWTQSGLGAGGDTSEAGDEFGDALTGSQCLHPCHAPFP